jgi:hypothetical protein
MNVPGGAPNTVGWATNLTASVSVTAGQAMSAFAGNPYPNAGGITSPSMTLIFEFVRTN